jgi:uncharacterized protein
MMLKDVINADFMSAYKEKNFIKKNFLGVLRGAIQTQEGKNIESTDENVLKLIKSMEKGLKENIDYRIKVNLPITDEEIELSYLEPYIPKLMSEEEIREAVRLTILESTNTNIGYIMGMFVKTYKGNADNTLVLKIIKEELL